jgi:hypothetical protein
VSDGETILSPIIREKIYGIPNDLVTIPPGDFTVTCDISEMFDPSILGAGEGGSTKTYEVDATYSNFLVDRDFVNGQCNNAPCFPNIFIGSVTSPTVTINIGGAPVTRRNIDIVPGDPTNTVSCTPKTPIPVAILGSLDFDVHTIDLKSVRFGKPGVQGARSGSQQFRDVNGDGITDMVLNFQFSDTGFNCSKDLPKGQNSATVTGILTGKTTGQSGVSFTDTDIILLTR